VTCDSTKREVRAADKNYCFDAVYPPASTQEDVYKDNLAPIVDEVLQGFNCTVFAYGQTGTAILMKEVHPDTLCQRSHAIFLINLH